MQIMYVPTEAENSVDFALEEIISENGLKGKFLLLKLMMQMHFLKKIGKFWKRLVKKFSLSMFQKQ